MGCWNQTCGLTQIHIRAGEKVIVVPLAEATRDSLCYTTPFWAPFLVPFHSEYNDYGGGENSSGRGLDLIIEYLQKHLVEIEQGPNESHDCAVKREGFDEDLFWESIHEQRLAISGYSDEKHSVGFVMIKESVYNYLAENFKFSSYNVDRKEYDEYTFNELLATIDPLIEALIQGPRKFEGLGENMSEEEKKGLYDYILMFDPVERIAREVKSESLAAKWLSYSSSHLRYSGFKDNIVDREAVKFMKAGDAESLKELLLDALKVQFIDSVLMSTRKFWSPQAGAGSQRDDIDSYRDLIAAMTHVLDEEEAERRSWND